MTKHYSLKLLLNICYKTHKKSGTGIIIIENIVGYIGPGRDDRAELTRADLIHGLLDPV